LRAPIPRHGSVDIVVGWTGERGVAETAGLARLSVWKIGLKS
jgi:hypothetical protein